MKVSENVLPVRVRILLVSNLRSVTKGSQFDLAKLSVEIVQLMYECL